MPELAEVAIELALLARAESFATAQGLTISLPNTPFTPPAAKSGASGQPTVYGKYLRATLLAAPSVETGISFNAHVQHYGMLQLDVFCGEGAGGPVPARIAASAIAYFPRGLLLTNDGINTRIYRAAYRGPLIVQDAWAMVPVSIPYICFARNPA